MTKLIAVLLVSVVVSVKSNGFNENEYPDIEIPLVAVPNFDPDYAPDNDKFCCFPEKWEGNVTGQGGRGGGRRGGGRSSFKVFVDQTSKSIAGRGTTGRFLNETGGFLMVFSSTGGSVLYLYNLDKSKCWNKTLTKATWRPQCVPENATLEGTFTVGPINTGLQVNSYRFRGRSHHSGDNRRGGKTAFVSGRIVVTAASPCVPVFIQNKVMVHRRPRSGPATNEIAFDQYEVDDDDDYDQDRRGRGGRGGCGSQASSAFFSNMKDTVDQGAFEVPTICKKSVSVGEDEEVYEMPVPDVLERFVSF